MPKQSLSATDVFKGFDQSELDLFEKSAKEKVFPADDIIFKEGDIGDKMYLIVDGIVEIWKSEDKELKGSRLARLKPGEIFGEMALFDRDPRSATAVAAISKETKILVWDEKDVRDVLEKSPKAGIKFLNNIIRKISTRLRIANDAIHTLLRANQYIGL